MAAPGGLEEMSGLAVPGWDQLEGSPEVSSSCWDPSPRELRLQLLDASPWPLAGERSCWQRLSRAASGPGAERAGQEMLLPAP